MKILIDICHPAHVHFYKNFIWEMEKRGHIIKVTSRKKDVTSYLLNYYKINHKVLSIHIRNLLHLSIETFHRWQRLLKIIKKFKPDIITDVGGAFIAFPSKVCNTKSIVFTDTEFVPINKFITYPFSENILTPKCFFKNLGKRHIKYDGYHELAYLHPKYFKPNPSVLDKANLSKDETFTIIRFVSWGASHDIGHSGISFENKKKAVENFSKFGKVLITSEKELPYPLDKYRISVPPEDIHSLIYYSNLLYGESATMSSEAAVLGTYSIYIDDEGRGYTDEQEKRFGLVNNFNESNSSQLLSIEKGNEILDDNNSKKEARAKSKKLLNEKIDVTKFMIEFFENEVKT